MLLDYDVLRLIISESCPSVYFNLLQVSKTINELCMDVKDKKINQFITKYNAPNEKYEMKGVNKKKYNHINFILPNGQLHGLWKMVDLHGHSKFEIMMENGKMDGELLVWNKDLSKVVTKINYKKNVLHGKYQKLYNNGRPLIDCTYENGKLEGIYREWHKSFFFMKKKCEYINGNKHGLYIEWYDDNKLRKRVNYINGKKHGSYRKWFDNGKKSCEKEYIDGKIDGYYKQYKYDENRQWV
jgi:antitoxin component YwqK of YwqJK toxin-antitoxin module